MAITRKGRYRVEKADGTLVSNHTTSEEAFETAVRTGITCNVVPPRYEVTNDWGIPAPTPTPTPAPAPDPTPFPVPITGASFLDLVKAPLGAWITEYQQLSDGEIQVVRRFQHDGSDPRIQTVTGRIIEATPATLAAIVQALAPGEHVYLRGGDYAGQYDDEGWNESNLCLFRPGTADMPIGMLAFPGETVTIRNTGGRPNFFLCNSGGNRKTAHLTIAGFNLVAQADCIDSSADTSSSLRPESGAPFVRAVGNRCTITDPAANTMTGIIALGADGWAVLGNTLRDPANRTIINNNHAIYVQCGADDVLVAYNDLRNLRLGHVIQVHQDGTPMLYTNLRIIGNVIQPRAVNDCRGITVSNVDSGSDVLIQANKLLGLGQDFSAVSVYRGVITVKDNDVLDCNAGLVLNGQLGGARRVRLENNLFRMLSGVAPYTFENGASAGELEIISER